MLLRISSFCLVFISLQAFSQDSGLLDRSSLPKPKTYDAAAVVDETYGIILYEKLNKSTGGDSVRKINGRPANGWVEDFYTSGKTLHKGYYFEGQLKVYKNFYENGQLERNFKAIDDYKSNIKLYYPDGKLKFEADYKDGVEMKASQYHPNGNLEFTEQLNKGAEYFISRESHFENGQLEKLITLTDKKKKRFSCQEYFENGKLKETGDLFYNSAMSDYQKDGTWKIFDETGKEIAEQSWIFGTLNEEKKR